MAFSSFAELIELMDRNRWKQIDEVLDAVLKLQPHERAAYLDQTCAGNNELRKEVEALLVSDEEAGSFIQVPVLDPDAAYLKRRKGATTPGSASPSHFFSLLDAEVRAKPELHARQTIAGRYELIARLGTGGMGEVWHAYDMKLRVDVALKSLRLRFGSGPDPVEALRREVRSAREVISPNVCRIFDLVVDDDREFISMEFIDGITLIDLLRQKGPLDLSKARDIAAQFLSGLEAIHRAGLIHCDLKPENIMITRTGRVVVMDFGIAKELQQTDGVISGTRPYMSPEQTAGRAIDVRSDLFSTGVILAEMIHPEGITTGETREMIWNISHRDPQQPQDTPWKKVITRALAMDPQLRFGSAQALSRALEKATVRTATVEERGPYPGLASFSSNDAQYFFGREMEVEAVMKKLQKLHLMAIVGASGAGKTSFLRAGLIPVVPADWNCIFCVPGDTPLLNLGQALVHQLSIDTEALREISHLDDPLTILRLMREWRKRHREVVLIVDRFEELFTLNLPEAQSSFAELIATASVDADVRVLLSMRDDFLLRCDEQEPLTPIFSELTPLGPLAGHALRRAFVQPALKCGYRFEDEELIDEVLEDVEKERGALPLMAFAASRLWEERDRAGGLLTRESYRAIGGVAGALAQHAEETMERIGLEKQSVVREIFRNLITAENTRMSREREELLSIFPEERAVAEEVLQTLIDARLLTTYDASQAKEKRATRRVEIVHESLLSHWPRLVRWQSQDADSAQLRDQLRQASQLWEERTRPADLLWTGTSYKEFEIWRERYQGGLTGTEQAFIHAMVRNSGKKKRQRRITIIATFVVLLGVLAAISKLWHQSSIARDEALLQARRAEAGTVLTAGRAIFDSDPTTKLAYALASLELADSPQARRFALQGLADGPVARILRIPIQPVNVHFSPDNRWIVAGGLDGSVHLVQRDGSGPVRVSQSYKPGHFIQWKPEFSPDGKLLLWTLRNDPATVKVWSLSSKEIVRTFRMEGLTMVQVRAGKAFFITDRTGNLETPFRWNHSVLRTWNFDSSEPQVLDSVNLGGNFWNHFDIDIKGRWIAYKKEDGIFVRSIDATGIGDEKLIGTHSADIKKISFHPNGEIVASSDRNGEIRLWSLFPGTNNSRLAMKESCGPNPIWFNTRGSILFAACKEQLYAWNLEGPEEAEPFIFKHPQGDIRHVATNPEDRTLCIAGGSTLSFYLLNNDHPYIFRNAYASNVRFPPDGKSLLNGLAEGNIRVWNISANRQSRPQTIGKPRQLEAESIDVVPRGKYVAASILSDGIHLISVTDGTDVPLNSRDPQKIYHTVAYSSDGKMLAAAGTEWIEMWDLQSGKSRILEQSKGMPIYSLKFSPDGTLFSGDSNGKLYRWNLTNNSVELLRTGKSWISGIAISNDGRHVASTSWSANTLLELKRADSELVIYDLEEQKSIPISSHGNRVFSVVFHPSGQLITGDFDGIIRLGPVTGQTPHLLPGHQSGVKDISVYGDRIVSLDFAGVVRLWRMPKGKPMDAHSREEFLNRLRDLTNARAIAAQDSPTGYRIDYERFPGW